MALPTPCTSPTSAVTASGSNGATNAGVTTIPVGTQPGDVGVNPNTNTIYIANFGSNSVSVINGTTNTVTAAIPVGSKPAAIGVNPNTNVVYVANNGDNTVSVIKGANNSVTATVSVVLPPVQLASTPIRTPSTSSTAAATMCR